MNPSWWNNLVRMSQGKMMGVDFNKDKTWVGASIALHQVGLTKTPPNGEEAPRVPENKCLAS